MRGEGNGVMGKRSGRVTASKRGMLSSGDLAASLYGRQTKERSTVGAAGGVLVLVSGHHTVTRVHPTTGKEGSSRKRSIGDSGSTCSDATWSESGVRLIRLRAARRVIQIKGQVAFSLVVFQQQQQQQQSSMTGSTTREAGSVQPVLCSMSSSLSTHHHLVIFGCFAWVTPLICTITATVTIITTTIVSGQSFSKQRTFENRTDDNGGSSISSCCAGTQ